MTKVKDIPVRFNKDQVFIARDSRGELYRLYREKHWASSEGVYSVLPQPPNTELKRMAWFTGNINPEIIRAAPEFASGWDAAREGQPENNPHEKGTDEYVDWSAGWNGWDMWRVNEGRGQGTQYVVASEIFDDPLAPWSWGFWYKTFDDAVARARTIGEAKIGQKIEDKAPQIVARVINGQLLISDGFDPEA